MKTVERTINGETKQVEWIGGFDATPYMDRASWGDARYKSMESDSPETKPGKVSVGDGCKIHPNKKNRFKLQSETDPDSKCGGFKSTRAAVKVIRAQGSDYIPVIDVSAKVAPVEPDNLEDIPELPSIGGISDGIATYGSDFWKKQAELKESAEYKAAEQAQREARARNEARKAEYVQELRAGIISESTPEFAYKGFRLLASDLVEAAKRERITPREFHNRNRGELERLSRKAAQDSGITMSELWQYIEKNAPKFYASCFAAQSEAKTAPKRTRKAPKALEDMNAEDLQAEYTKRRDAYIEALAELNKRLEENGRPGPPQGPEGIPAPIEANEVEDTVTNPEEYVETVTLTRAEKRAAMREAKARQKAHRRTARKMARQNKERAA